MKTIRHLACVLSMVCGMAALLCGGEALAATYQLTPTEDAWTYAYSPDAALGLDSGIATAMQFMSPRGYAYLKFTLPTLTNETVQSAVLNLYQFLGGGYGEGPTAVGLFSNNNWSESTITWNNAPTGTITGLATCSDGGSHRGVSMWSFLWNSNIADTFTLILWENSSGDQSHNWYSKEWSDSSQRPYLEISTVANNPVPVPPAFLLLGSGLAGLVGVRRRFSRKRKSAVNSGQIIERQERLSPDSSRASNYQDF